MSLPDTENGRHIDKGKQRANDIDERTPLLASSSATSSQILTTSVRHPRRHRLWHTLFCVFSVSLALCTVLAITLILLAWSYASRASDKPLDDVLQQSVHFVGPRRVNVLNITSSGGIWVEVEGDIGVDAGSIIGVHREPYGDGFLFGLWKKLGRWGIEETSSVSIKLDTVTFSTSNEDASTLALVAIPPMDIGVTAEPSRDTSWLQPTSVTVFIQPSSNTSVLLNFLRDSWRLGAFAVAVHVNTVGITGGTRNIPSWRRFLHGTLHDVDTSLRMKIPSIPGLPSPGRDQSFPSISDLVTLQSFNVWSQLNQLHLEALATIVDPAPEGFAFTTPPLEFMVSLTDPNSTDIALTPIASVSSAPFQLTHPNITLDISGTVLPLRKESMALLSDFLSRYLSALPNNITISTPHFPNVLTQVVFPAPNPRPQILRNVTIQDMKLKPGNTFLASGVVFANVVLPKGMDVGLDINAILPDVLVFDGEVPDDIGIPSDDLVLPDPLPERAFGHIRPDEYLNATCKTIEHSKNDGSSYRVTAQIVDVPLEVLPGRQKEFSDFVSKVIFSRDGAIAGILGSSAVRVNVEGLPISSGNHGVELDGLPFKGSVKIGKRSL